MAQNNPAAVTFLEAWVRNGGWLLAHGADNQPGDYFVPGLTGVIDENDECSGLTLLVSDHALVRGPDAVLGTADDLMDGGIDSTGCSDNHGSLEGILPENAQVMMIEEGGSNRPVYATYTLGSGRVIVSSATLECTGTTVCDNPPLPILLNHYYWTINGLDAPPATPPFTARVGYDVPQPRGDPKNPVSRRNMRR